MASGEIEKLCDGLEITLIEFFDKAVFALIRFIIKPVDIPPRAVLSAQFRWRVCPDSASLPYIHRETTSRRHANTEAMYQHDLLRMGGPRAVDTGRKMFSSELTGHVSDDQLYLQEILDHMCCLRPSFTRSL